METVLITRDHFTPTRFLRLVLEAFNWAYEIGLRLGFGIKKSSNKKVGRNTNLRQRYFVCRMGGKGPVNKDADSLMRGNTATAWCNCKFSMKVVELEENKWRLVMRSGFHNHGLTLSCDFGDVYFAKFDDDELAFIDAQVRAHVRPAIISAGLHQRNPEKSRPNRRQIYKRRKVRVEERDGRNPKTTDIDSTYKTNEYRLPLVEMVGVTPVGKSFVIAYALVTHESEEKYLWVLRKSRPRSMMPFNLMLLLPIARKNAITELRKEFERGAKMTEDALTIDCGCVKATTLGLLCACSLHRISRNGSRVPVDVLHAFWRKLEYDGSEAMPTCDDDRLEELFDEIRMRIRV
ncbi:uncharacterized protein LOC141612792 [Silene latifolia]|uniref:uncharacterized protein LOC141612792 n=1 Tax=Silene latifolia TaxID=37657 RepID=UPI003D77E8A2